MRKHFAVAVGAVGLLITGCFGASTDVKEPVEPADVSIVEKKQDRKKKKKAKQPPIETYATDLPPDPCQVFEGVPQEPPFYVSASNVMITRFMKPCVTRDGKRGFEKDTPWIAMGFPCTGGGGKIQITGYVSEPKLVSFPLSTDCSMQPRQAQEVDATVKEATGLPAEASIMAYYPFVVQYWEIPDYEDADVGFSVDLVTTRARASLWREMRLHDEPISVRLYGRENAWVQGDQVYEVLGTLKKTGARSFQLQVESAKALTAEEIDVVKERCYGLSPRRNCASAF